MTNKQAQEKLKAAAAKAVDNFDPNMFVETRDVLALLDELDNREKLRAAANRVVNQQDIELQELRQRVAELEAREVRLPQRYSMLHRTDFGELYHTEMVYKQHQVLEALADAGIRINGEG